MEIFITILIVLVAIFIIYKNIQSSSKGQCNCSGCSKSGKNCSCNKKSNKKSDI